MTLNILGRLALGLVATVAGIGPAFADEPVEHGGNGYHKAVCARAIARGEARCFAHIRVDEAGNPIHGKPDGAAPNVVPAGLGVADLRIAYGVGATGISTTVIAIVDAYGYAGAEADLAVYRAQYGLPPCTSTSRCFTKIDQRGGRSYPRANTGWAQEQALDLDMASAMCPNCSILLVQADSASFADLAAAVNMAAATLGVRVISNSYGGGEAGSTLYNPAYIHPGIAVTASSGDSGYGVSFPASSPGTIAVGGTSLTRAAGTARGWSETAWAGAGSGCSAVYAKPVWQTDTQCARRTVADISAVADPATGVAVYGPNGRGSQTSWLVFGGTSVAAPLIGGIYGALGAVSAAPNAAQKIWQTAPAGLNDVTSGSNGKCGGSYLCQAGPGFDGPTGNGTPAGAAAF